MESWKTEAEGRTELWLRGCPVLPAALIQHTASSTQPPPGKWGSKEHSNMMLTAGLEILCSDLSFES